MKPATGTARRTWRSKTATSFVPFVFGPVGKELLSPEWAERILSWRHAGFNVHSRVRARLESAVKHLQELIAKDPVDVPKPPPYPDKKKF